MLVVGLAGGPFAGPLAAWDGEGHMAVAWVAYQQLTQASKDRVDVLLRKNPYYNNQWKALLPAGVSAAEKKLLVFMLAATWADAIKGDSTYSDDGPDPGGNVPGGITSTQNIGYSDKLRHRYWHFVDLGFSTDGTAVPATPTPDAETQIAVFREVLSSNQPDTLKSYDLVWLMHLVGDVHQPLHCTTRVEASHPSGDAGGNSVKVCPGTCTGVENPGALHAYWDNLLGTLTKPDEVLPVAQALPAADAVKATDVNGLDWVIESRGLAETAVYVGPVGAGWGPFALTPEYESAAAALARQQIALAGARLAKILNAELK